jgi:hypothetical protein
MIRTGLEKSGLFYCVARSFFCMAAVMILLGSVGCSNRVVRKSRALQPEAPEVAVSEAAVQTEVADEAISENGGGVGVPPAEVAIQAASEGADGAAILQQTRGAVFASLTTIVGGAGPPASTVKESSEPGADPGSQDSITSLTGEDSPLADSAGAVVTAEGTDEAETPPVEAVTSSASADEPVSEEVAEASIAEPTPPPAEETPTEEAPAEEPIVSAEAEVARVESPPSATVPPISEASAAARLATNNPPSDAGSGGRSNTASVLFLVLGGIGAALILIRRRATA